MSSATSRKGVAQKWWETNEVVSAVLRYSNPRDAFFCRSVCRYWCEVVNNAPSAFWRLVVGACVPSCELTLKLLSRVTPQYMELRHFSKMSLGNTRTLQHVLFVDITSKLLLWLTNVPLVTPVQHLYDVAEAILHDELEPCDLSLLGSGLPLERTKTIEQHTWPTRGGKKGWRLDMIIVVRGFVRRPRGEDTTDIKQPDNAMTESRIDTEASEVDVRECPREWPAKDNLVPQEFSNFHEKFCCW